MEKATAQNWASAFEKSPHYQVLLSWDRAQRANAPELRLSEEFRSLLINAQYDFPKLQSLYRNGAIPDFGNPHCWPILFLLKADVPLKIFTFLAFETTAAHIYWELGNQSLFQHFFMQERLDLIRILLEHGENPKDGCTGMTNLVTFIFNFMYDRDPTLLNQYLEVRGKPLKSEIAKLKSDHYPDWVLEHLIAFTPKKR